MYPYIKILGSNVPSYVLCSSIGLIFSTLILSELLKRKFLLRKYTRIITISLVGIFLGGKLFGILSYMLYLWNEFQRISIIESIKYSGIVFYGGLLGYLGTLQVFCKICKRNFSDISDEIAVSIPLFHSFARIGCFFAGCCYGKVYTGIFAINYRIGFDGIWEQRYPTQLLEAIFEFVIFIILYNIYHSKKKCWKINLLNIYLGAYAVFRFIIEFCRGDEIRGFLGNISFSQEISLIILSCMIISFIKMRKEKLKNV